MNRVVALMLCLLSVTAVAKPGKSFVGNDKGAIQIIIDPVFNNNPLVLDSTQYVNEHGDTLSISLLRFYISNIILTERSGSKYTEQDSYHLVSTEDSGSNIFSIRNVAVGSYTTMQFTLGVDSMANVSGAMGGDLDPTKGMYWAWNTGYIMAKLEGRSKVCKTLHHAFEFHIGGYIPPYSTARLVSLPLETVVIVKNGAVTIVHIKADIATWFKGKRVIDLSKLNSVVMPGADAMTMADNYKSMFLFSSVVNP